MPRRPNPVTCICGKRTDYPIDGLYCSYACRPPEPKKPRATGSKARKARIRQMVKDFSTQDWTEVLTFFDNRCAYCGEATELQQEHFLPVHLGGSYTPDNIIPACKTCNARKSNKDPFDYLVVQERRLREYLRITEYLSSRTRVPMPLDDPQEAPGRT
jgi:5-methylcytosine-specific restriction endonuclease McrA